MEKIEVLRYFAGHHGVISREEALGLGMTPDQVRRRRQGGEWIEISPTVFRHAAAPASWLGAARAGALSVDSVVSHLTAARVWRLDGFSHRRIEVVVAQGHHRRRGEVIVHRSVNMDLAGQTVRQGVPVTGISRTILDVAGCVNMRRLHHAVDSAFRLRLVTWQMLYSVLVRHSARGRDGCGPLRLLLEERFGDMVIPDSNWNRDVGVLLTDAGLPVPDFEFVVRRDQEFIARVDLAYPKLRLAIECDSVRWHGNSESFVKDPRRRNKLLNAGWRVLSFTWEDYAKSPAALVTTVYDAIKNSELQIGREMLGLQPRTETPQRVGF